jgi:hypothetical protein
MYPLTDLILNFFFLSLPKKFQKLFISIFFINNETSKIHHYNKNLIIQ